MREGESPKRKRGLCSTFCHYKIKLWDQKQNILKAWYDNSAYFRCNLLGKVQTQRDGRKTALFYVT